MVVELLDVNEEDKVVLDEEKIIPAESDRISFKRSYFYAAIAPITFVLGLAFGFLLWGNNPPPTSGTQTTNNLQAAAVLPQSGIAEITRFEVGIDDDPAIGVAGAPITIIEFSDFECPFCQRFHDQTFQAILESYPGQILFVYRDFPLASIHPNAQKAAEAAQCAFEQGKYWEFHNALFRNQQHLGNLELYTELAVALEMDQERFNECFESNRYADEVTADFNDARALGITGTPTFFINGRPLVGAQPLDVFVQIIEEELAGQ